MKIEGISVFTGRPVTVRWEGQTITEIAEIESRDALPYLSPGFLDMQVNGYNGSDYSLDDFGPDHLVNIIESMARSGTTQHVPTIVSSPQERILRNLRILAEQMERSLEIESAIAGIHIEGPFISSEDGPRGAHDPAYVRNPSFGDFQAWQEAAGGRISIVTVGPEREGALDFIRRVKEQGVTVAIGHTGAEPQQIWKAVEAGATLSTHLGNGSYTQIPRLKNYIWEQLAADELTAGIISDGFHLPSSVVKVFTRAKGLDRLVLVSDVALLGGFSPGVYKWGNLDVEVFDDGHLGLPGTTILAGAAHLLDWDLAHYMEFTGLGLAESIPLCSINPARVLGLPKSYGRLEEGAPANLVTFRWQPGDERLKIESTIQSGRRVYASKGG
ncbi:MAG: amidohydrolase family protein [Spirochaetales bacterium]|nr:amidohydrolase family protein [Spirochaetales bacterium]